MEINQLEMQLKTLLDQTLLLKNVVSDEEAEPDQWGLILDTRQETMNQVTSLINQGTLLTDPLKEKYLVKAYKIDQEILPIMNKKRDNLSDKIGSITSTKNTVKKYNNYSNIAYFSSFFDQKK